MSEMGQRRHLNPEAGGSLLPITKVMSHFGHHLLPILYAIPNIGAFRVEHLEPSTSAQFIKSVTLAVMHR